MQEIYLYTDGACSGNPGKGGWAALLRYGDVEKTLTGNDEHTTNNRMELMAVIQGLKALRRPCKVNVMTDSQYVCKNAEQYLAGWIQKGWKTSAKKDVLNVDLWQDLNEQLHKHQIIWHWVKGHNGHPENEKVDTLAREAILELWSK